MSVNEFLTKKNVELIWEVVMDDILKYKPQEIITQMNNVFNTNLSGFYDNEKNKTNNLMDLNKKFISLIINYIHQNYSQKIDNNNNNNSNNSNSKKALVTYEDLQTDRISQFDKKLNLRKQEFTNAMTLPVPKVPDFSDSSGPDIPIGELVLEIKKVMAQRNYDIEQINRNITINNEGLNTNTNWLKPQETSVKNEKVILQNKSNIKPTQQPLKYIKIDNKDLNNEVLNNEVIDINIIERNQLNSKKQVSWNNTVNYEDDNINNINNNTDDFDLEPDFFKKLKTIKPPISEEEMKNNIMKEEIKTINVKIDNLTQNVNIILELLKQKI